ncbi:lanthionine synthetase C family protein [Pseudoalteromonas sp. T1lg65]|uniref:lanthionine synthetase C family protein n=1 Tax=Pseudoalteromonas sp. T1lg65 TaxID=2077101 RepID=UPI003F79450D
MFESLSVEKKEQITAIIEHLVEVTEDRIKTTNENGLLGGIAGKLLFLFNAAQYKSGSVDEELFAERLDKLQEELVNQSPELSSGLAGQVWLLELLNQSEQDDYDPALLQDIDELFADALDFSPWTGEIEMVLGLSGYAPYVARRARKTDQSVLFDRLLTGFETTLTELDDNKVTWSQPLQSMYRMDREEENGPEGAEYNLGLAHGVPGIIAAILPALSCPTHHDRAKRLLEGACDWLLEQQLENTHAASCFGTCAGKDHGSRLGWCYGDLPIAVTLARAGKALDRPSYVDKALEITLKNTSRDEESGHIYDAGLCHGYFGLVTMFQVLYHHFPHPEIAQAAQKWLDYGLEKYQQKGLESLYAYRGDTKDYREDTGFLMGYPGVGLALLSVLTDDLDWADCLLLN